MINKSLKNKLAKQRQTIEIHNRNAIDGLIETVGSPMELSIMLNVHLSTVMGWKQRGRISKEGAKLVTDHPVLRDYYKVKDLRLDLAEKVTQ